MIFKNEINGCMFDTETLTAKGIDGSTKTFHSDHVVRHVGYTMAKYPQRFQDLVDEGEILEYLIDFDESVSDAIHGQVEMWLEDDKKYRLAVSMGNLLEAERIANMYKLMAKEPIYEAMVYV